MRLVLLEDDHHQAEEIIRALCNALSLTTSDIKWIKTEHDFRTQLNDIVAFKPAVIILDVMVRWCDPAPKMPERPTEVKTDGHYVAGIRCQQLLAQKLRDAKRGAIPVIFYTVIDEPELKASLGSRAATEVTIIGKSANVNPLLDRIRSLSSCAEPT